VAQATADFPADLSPNRGPEHSQARIKTFEGAAPISERHWPWL
jgi:hypothetical protein